ncbi:WxL domain-containing protein [uncultured Vagococcus sp.]|uniref:WxL domain-containing protein n=1 Tax=uncultured Vagococcus sp. TaxID=189676 RepID=UPI0028D3899C|nr:WxL domain-containing protein [uncultured Vagococcus sp.]
MMLLTKKITVSLWAALLGVVVSEGTVMAEVKDRYQSDLQAEVIEGNPLPRPPLFGTDPEDNENEGTTTPGYLTIDRVPNLSFGKVVASGLYQTEYALNSNPYIQVSDLRGSLGGWTVSAKISDFISKRTASDTRRYLLGGASLKIQQANVENYQSEEAAPPLSYPVTLNKEYQKVMMAETDSGQGIWSSRWQSKQAVNDKIELAILPGTAEPGREYEATISWKLADVPNN